MKLLFFSLLLNNLLKYIDGNVSKAHILIFDENAIFTKIYLIPFSIKCQWLVPKSECKVYQKGQN